MITAKNGNLIFKNRAELNAETNKRIKKILETEIVKYKQSATKEALILLLPLACTSLYEAYGLAEKRQERFIDYFITHMECINDGITDIEEYRKWCQEQGYKYFNVVEVENEQ